MRGDWVWILYPPEAREKFGRGWKGPYLVLNRLGEVNYRVQKEPNSTPITVHIDHMKNYGHGDTPEVWIAGNGLNFREMGVQVNFQ